MGFVTRGNVDLEINGIKFNIDSTDIGLAEEMDKFARESQVKMAENSKKEDIVGAVKDTIEYALETIDKFLGEGSSKEIFRDEKVSIFKAVSVINYINDEVKKSNDAMNAKFSPNRAQRRKK